jgi:hypothetical protein
MDKTTLDMLKAKAKEIRKLTIVNCPVQGFYIVAVHLLGSPAARGRDNTGRPCTAA